jgi:hypothetical protein
VKIEMACGEYRLQSVAKENVNPAAAEEENRNRHGGGRKKRKYLHLNRSDMAVKLGHTLID